MRYPINRGFLRAISRGFVRGSRRARLVALLGALALLVGATSLALAATTHTTATTPGTIAYARDGKELRLIQPDGANDHRIWSEPAGDGNTLFTTAWRPDGAEIAFASNHEGSTSLYQSDVYGVRPDGTGLRRITAPPDVSQLAGYPQGSVTVTVSDLDVGDGPLVVYMEGAPQPQAVVLSPGASATVTFASVAAFPNGPGQYPVAMYGLYRWIGVPVVVQAGGSVFTSLTVSTGGTLEAFGASAPAWRSDGTQLDYLIGAGCTGVYTPTSPPPGAIGSLLLPGTVSMCPMDVGPTQSQLDQLVYYDALGARPKSPFASLPVGKIWRKSAKSWSPKSVEREFSAALLGGIIYRATQNSASASTPLVSTGWRLTPGIRWLPDGSGFLFAQEDALATNSNIFAYDFASAQMTQLTQFTGEYAGSLAISPDGRYLVFEHSAVDPNPIVNPTFAADLWIMGRDGTGMRTLVTNARYPSWSGQAPSVGPPGFHVYLPAISR